MAGDEGGSVPVGPAPQPARAIGMATSATAAVLSARHFTVVLYLTLGANSASESGHQSATPAGRGATAR